MKSLGTEFKVGLFAIVALAALGYMFFVLSPETFENKEYRRYYTVLSNAAGIVSKTHVKTSGVTIGKVISVALEGNTTRVVLQVDKAVKVPTSSRIEIRSVGLLGDVHLEIVRGEDNGQYVEDGGIIPQSAKSMDMQEMFANVGDLVTDMKKITSTLATVFGSKKGEQAVENILTNLEGITKDLKATTATVKNVVGDREGDYQRIVTDTRATVADLRQFSGNLKDMLNQENRDRIDRILTSFDETMVDVKGGAKNINLIAEKVEKGEGTIGKLVNDDNTIAELEGAIKDIRKVLAPANKLSIDVDYHNEVRRDDNFQHYVNLAIRTRPDRFYLLGFTDTKADVQKIETTTNQDGNKVSQTQTTETTRGIKFNAQIGKRWYWTTVRVGFFESSGGFAADFHLFDDRIKLTAEAFDFDLQNATVRRNAHLKTYASILFYNHIYVLAGIDDPTRTVAGSCAADKCKVDQKANFFGGVGLTFNDQDLKAVLGTAALAR